MPMNLHPGISDAAPCAWRFRGTERELVLGAKRRKTSHDWLDLCLEWSSRSQYGRRGCSPGCAPHRGGAKMSRVG